MPRDTILEEAALRIESAIASVLDDIPRRALRRRREREDAALRADVVRETRRRCAIEIRRLKADWRSDPVEVLRVIAADIATSAPHDFSLMRAWPLAWQGLLVIEAVTTVVGNTVPPPTTEWRITITDAGRELMAKAPSKEAV